MTAAAMSVASTRTTFSPLITASIGHDKTKTFKISAGQLLRRKRLSGSEQQARVLLQNSKAQSAAAVGTKIRSIKPCAEKTA